MIRNMFSVLRLIVATLSTVYVFAATSTAGDLSANDLTKAIDGYFSEKIPAQGPGVVLWRWPNPGRYVPALTTHL